jgi:hypothetical protein
MWSETEAKVERAADLLRRAEQVLARDPTFGYKAPLESLWTLGVFAPWDSDIGIFVYYRFDDLVVTLEGVATVTPSRR